MTERAFDFEGIDAAVATLRRSVLGDVPQREVLMAVIVIARETRKLKVENLKLRAELKRRRVYRKSKGGA